MEEKKLRFSTLALHGGQQPDPTTGAMALPIYQTTSYAFNDTEHAARLFALEEPGNIYTRLMNPTTDVLEKRVALLEGGVAGVAAASGQAAITQAVLTLVREGDRIVSSSGIYGGTHNLFNVTFRRLGIETVFCESDDPEEFRKHVSPNTKLFYSETIGNPRLTVPDFEGIAAVAHEAGVPLMVDNTTASPYLCRPLSHGADIVVHSLTKYLGGHGTSIGGMVVDGGRFDWAGSGRFGEMVDPDPSYHGVEYVRQFGEMAYAVKVRVQLLRDLGACISPFNAFLIVQGIETLPLRMDRHCRNAQRVAEWLNEHSAVAWVNYPGLPQHPSHAVARKYLPRGCSGLIGFGIKGGLEAGKRFINSLGLITHLANIGDARSLAIHPASTTHQQLTEEEQRASGVTPDYIRMSIGLEDVSDILDDLDQALGKAV